MKIIRNSILPPKGYKAITLFCFIFIKKDTKLSQRDINHETIHWEQEKELGIIGFYLLYILFFIWNMIIYRLNWNKSYHNIPFECEAYMDSFSLEDRKHYGWIKYIGKTIF